MFFPQEPRPQGGRGPNAAPSPTPPRTPLPSGIAPPLLPGCQEGSGDSTQGTGVPPRCPEHPPRTGGGVVPPPPIQPHAGVRCYPPQPHSSYLWVLLGSPSNKGLGLPWLRGRDRGPYGGALPCTPPARTAPGGGTERPRGARSRAFIGVGRARSCSGLPRPWPRRRLWGAWRGGRYEKSRGSEPGAPSRSPPCVQRRSSPGRGGGGPGVSTI